MEHVKQNRAVIAHTSVKEYFHDSVHGALQNQHIKAQDATASYLVNLLCNFMRADELYEDTTEGRTIQPLALLYARAVNTSSSEEKRQCLQRLGDLALFVAGIFSQSLNRKIVDVDYYIAMGGNAYGYLSHTAGVTTRGRALADVFAELSTQFQLFVDVLMEVSERAHLNNDGDILRLYEIWLRTGSKRASARLQRLGIVPALQSTSRLHH